MHKYLNKINTPADLKQFTVDDLPAIAAEMRAYIIDVVSKHGGHLGASLGTVELTLAAHYVFDTPRDKIVWDVGHQAYTHKILTGRRDAFPTLRQKDGISGFPKRSESEYDTFGVGHASTAISAALGIACARDIAGDDYSVAAIVGDGALTGGISFEGINNAGTLKKDIIIILNDNEMSISRNVGALSKYLTAITSGKLYNKMEADVWELLGMIPKVGGKTRKLAGRIKESIKTLIVPGVIFEELGFRYFGPVDGHNVEFLVQTLRDIKKLKGPILIHVLTKKGKGYEYAENDDLCCHGVTSFDKVPGDRKSGGVVPAYTDVFGQTICELAAEDKSIVAITAAMPDNTGLKEYSQKFPKRFFDVGIAEAHAVTFAAGLATEGLKPFVAIYSSFMQRAIDQVIHDVALQNLPVRFILDRGGIVGEDGPTHHGVFDLSYLRMIPNLVLMSPKDENEMRRMIKTMAVYGDGPIALRFPRGCGSGVPMDQVLEPLPIGKGEVVVEGRDIAFIALGSSVSLCLETAGLLKERSGIEATVVNMRFAKPLDAGLLEELIDRHHSFITVEENALMGGFGGSILEYMSAQGHDSVRVECAGIPDRFIEHGTRTELMAEIDLEARALARRAEELLRIRKLVK
jgi:1-deoxy-D-xylulose-5-phosphate synthase